MRNKLVLLVFCLVLFVSNLRAQRVQMQQRFESAYKEIVDMLEDKEPLSIKRSVFLAEWAYLEGHLDFEQDFCEPLQRGAQYMRRLITANKWEKYKTAKQIAICTFFFQSLSGNNNTMFSYDFSNEYPDEDWHHQLVSRTLKTHKGQCHSLPWAFKLYAEELGAKAYIAHAPRHCFVMYKDEDNLFPEDWVNVEVTAQQYQPTWGIKEHFEIEDSAIIAKTYLSPLTDKETVACQLSDLALAYYHKFLRYDEFTLKCVDASLKYYPMNPNAIITKGKSLDALLQRHLEQNGCLRDDYTDEIDAKSKQCIQDLRATHWTQETEALRSKWKQSPEDIERIRKNVQIIK